MDKFFEFLRFKTFVSRPIISAVYFVGQFAIFALFGFNEWFFLDQKSAMGEILPERIIINVGIMILASLVWRVANEVVVALVTVAEKLEM